MHISELKESRFLTRADVSPEALGTITSVSQQVVQSPDGDSSKKWCVHFKEFDKPLILNSTNGQLIAAALSSENSDEWIGKQITLFDDKTVAFGGKIVGGIRVKSAGSPF